MMDAEDFDFVCQHRICHKRATGDAHTIANLESACAVLVRAMKMTPMTSTNPLGLAAVGEAVAQIEKLLTKQRRALPQGPVLSGIQDTPDTEGRAGSALPKGGQ